MKKSLLALAVLGAFSGVAAAQSSVTLYGVLDVGLKRDSATKWTAWGVDGASYHTPSRFGLKGSEDLGGGNRAIFDLQTSGFGMGDGKQKGGGFAFGREAYVGLSNAALGTVKAGLDVSLGTSSFAGINLNGISTSDAWAAVGLNPVTWYGSSRRKGFVSYTTANFGGFDAAVGYTLKQTAQVLGDTKAQTQVRANYTIGGLSLAAVAETAHTAANRTAWALGAKYDAPMFVVSGGYDRGESAAVGKGVLLGGAGKFGAAQVGLQYAKNQTTHDAGVELFANYALSKRSTLYVDYLNKKVDATNTKTNSIGLGVQHNF
jgi:predicted porin